MSDFWAATTQPMGYQSVPGRRGVSWRPAAEAFADPRMRLAPNAEGGFDGYREDAMSRFSGSYLPWILAGMGGYGALANAGVFGGAAAGGGMAGGGGAAVPLSSAVAPQAGSAALASSQIPGWWGLTGAAPTIASQGASAGIPLASVVSGGTQSAPWWKRILGMGGGGGGNGFNLGDLFGGVSGLIDTGAQIAAAKIMADAANKATETLAQYGQKALDFEERRYGDAKTNYAPYLNVGTNALTTLADALRTPQVYGSEMDALARRRMV